MVALIYELKGTTEILLYNEKKVALDRADYILAGNFPLGTQSLDLGLKNKYLARRCSLNENVLLPAVHIILNFHPSDLSRIDQHQLAICWKFMEAVGFGIQPYLAYRHRDTQNPHIHIVTTNILANGRRIRMHRIGLLRSDPAQREIERIFGLVRAKQTIPLIRQSDTNNIQELNYGKVPTKLSIERTTAHLMERYSFGDLREWNTLLKTFGIKCSLLQPSEKRSSTGLLYFITNKNGVSLSVGIPASRLKNRPTLASLEEIFRAHGERVGSSLRRIRVVLGEQALLPENDRKIEDALLQQGIQLIKSAATPTDTIFIDHLQGCTISISRLQQPFLRDIIIKGITPQCTAQKQSIRERTLRIHGPNR